MQFTLVRNTNQDMYMIAHAELRAQQKITADRMSSHTGYATSALFTTEARPEGQGKDKLGSASLRTSQRQFAQEDRAGSPAPAAGARSASASASERGGGSARDPIEGETSLGDGLAERPEKPERPLGELPDKATFRRGAR